MNKLAVIIICFLAGLIIGAAAFDITRKSPSHQSPPVAVKHCLTNDYAINCGLPKPPPGLGHARPLFGAGVLQGIDFAWSKFSPQSAGSFGASYLSYDASKNWSPSLIRAYHAAGRGTVAVWETSATRAAQGCAAGASDARASEGLLTSWGYPHSHFDMAIDFDAAGSQVISYFRCANQAEPGLVGAYGGYRPLAYLCANHVTNRNWQTYAWSGGAWLPASCAPLEQYLNGSTFDHDRAIAADYGQFPGPKPPPPPDPFRVLDKKVRTYAHGVKASEYNTAKTWKTHGCKRPVVRPVCKATFYHARLIRDRLWFVAHNVRDTHGKWHARKKVDWTDNNVGARFKFFQNIDP